MTYPRRSVRKLMPCTRRAPHALVLLTCCWLGCQEAASPEVYDAAADQAAIHTLLQRQVDAWNQGDIEAFMDGYARTDSLRFASGGTEHRGWQATLERYHRAYPDRTAMGILTFDLRDVRILTPRWAVVFGSYQLERVEDRPSGLFTLLFEKRPEGWRIVHDHTSAGS